MESRGYSAQAGRQLEVDTLFDRALPDGSGELRQQKKVLRLRRVFGADGKLLRVVVTYKGEPQAGPHKVREEIEFGATDPEAVQLVLQRLEFHASFRYEKYRTTLIKEGDAGVITLDETPIGIFLELEGPADWIDSTARDLGFTAANYVTASYATLYLLYTKQNVDAPADMVFPKLI